MDDTRDAAALQLRLKWPTVGASLRTPLRSAVRMLGHRLITRARPTAPARDARKRARIDRIIAAFEHGYLCACDVAGEDDLRDRLIDRLNRLDAFDRGFAFEGAAMAVVLLDICLPWRAPLFPALLSAATDHPYLLHVGAGWALARFRNVEGRRFRSFDPLLRWLAIDAVGFHDGFMRGTPTAAAPRRRARFSPDVARVFDQGLGRSLWFTSEADSLAIVRAISAESPARQPDLWSGVGLACAYAGGASSADIEYLGRASGQSWPHVAQGMAFAAEAHMRGAGVDAAPPHLEDACRIVCGLSAVESARITQETMVGLERGAAVHAYEVWRARIRARIAPDVTAIRPDGERACLLD
jgi:enediyne biosynthesis protein E3